MNRTKTYFLFFLLSLFSYYPSVWASDALAEDLSTLEIGSTPVRKRSKIEPGFLYRQSAADLDAPVDGVYAKKVSYYGESLFADTKKPSMKDYVFSQKTADSKNWMGVVFFGIWSYPVEKDIDEVKKVIIPLRGLDKKGHMTYMAKKKRFYQYRCVWRTGHGEAEVKKVGNKGFKHIPAKGIHTETPFIDYIKAPQTQRALWEYFLCATEEEGIPSATRVLDCIGLTVYSTLDACDSCLDNLLKLKKAGLPHFVPEGTKTICSPLPFFITYASTKAYRPFHPYETSFSNASIYRSSILFTLPPRLFRLAKKEKGSYASVSKKKYDKVKHKKEVTFSEKENPDYLLLRIAEGSPITVTVGP